jgi:hypothetical protein
MPEKHATPAPDAPKHPKPGPQMPRRYRFTDWASI